MRFLAGECISIAAMSENPYAPPSSQVADIEGDTASLERPRLVNVGIGLLAMDLVLGIVGLFRDGGASLVFTVAIIGVMGLFTWYAWKGRNWARIVHLVVLLIAVLATTLAIAVLRANPNIAGGSGEVFFTPWTIAQNALNIAGVVLLFTPAANAWYRATKAVRLGVAA